MTRTASEILANIVPCQDCGGYVSDHEGVQGDCNYEAGTEIVDEAQASLLKDVLDLLPERDRPKLGSENQEVYVAYANGYNRALEEISTKLKAYFGGEDE